jgi:hypothetical protein
MKTLSQLALSLLFACLCLDVTAAGNPVVRDLPPGLTVPAHRAMVWRKENIPPATPTAVIQ